MLVDDDIIWRAQDRFPLGNLGGTLRLTDDEPSEPTIRPFALQNVSYSTEGHPYRMPQIELCPERQIGLVDGEVAHRVLKAAATMTQYDTDGRDAIAVDYMEDDWPPAEEDD